MNTSVERKLTITVEIPVDIFLHVTRDSAYVTSVTPTERNEEIVDRVCEVLEDAAESETFDCEQLLDDCKDEYLTQKCDDDRKEN